MKDKKFTVEAKYILESINKYQKTGLGLNITGLIAQELRIIYLSGYNDCLTEQLKRYEKN